MRARLGSQQFQRRLGCVTAINTFGITIAIVIVALRLLDGPHCLVKEWIIVRIEDQAGHGNVVQVVDGRCLRSATIQHSNLRSHLA